MMEYGWIVWVAAMVLFAIVEAATVSLVSVWFVGGSLAALIVELLGGSMLVQILVFLAVSAVLLALLGIAGSLIVAGVVHHLLTTRKGGAK